MFTKMACPLIMCIFVSTFTNAKRLLGVYTNCISASTENWSLQNVMKWQNVAFCLKCILNKGLNVSKYIHNSWSMKTWLDCILDRMWIRLFCKICFFLIILTWYKWQKGTLKRLYILRHCPNMRERVNLESNYQIPLFVRK